MQGQIRSLAVAAATLLLTSCGRDASSATHGSAAFSGAASVAEAQANLNSVSQPATWLLLVTGFGSVVLMVTGRQRRKV